MLRISWKSTVFVSLVLGIFVVSAGIATADATNPCKGDDEAVCSTLAPAGGDTWLLTVQAPTVKITAFDIWTGAPTTKLRPKHFCKDTGVQDGSQYQLQNYYVTHCVDTIKPGHKAQYCYDGGGGIPFAASPAINPVYVAAGAAGAQNVWDAPAVSGCPASVVHRKHKKHKKHH
jgi:hypothetical protein